MIVIPQGVVTAKGVTMMESGTGLRANLTADLPPGGRLDARLLEE